MEILMKIFVRMLKGDRIYLSFHLELNVNVSYNQTPISENPLSNEFITTCHTKYVFLLIYMRFAACVLLHALTKLYYLTDYNDLLSVHVRRVFTTAIMFASPWQQQGKWYLIVSTCRWYACRLGEPCIGHDSRRDRWVLTTYC